MKRGPKPTPTSLRKLHGNPGRRRPPSGEPTAPLVQNFPVPSHLRADAAREWKKITERLRNAKLITELDLGLLECWCSARGDFVEAERALKRGGPVRKDRDKNERRSPWYLVKIKAMEQLQRFAGEFGLSPAARPRLAASKSPSAFAPLGDEPSSEPPLDEFLGAHPDGPGGAKKWAAYEKRWGRA